MCKAFPSSEVRIASLLALNGTLFLASRQRFLALSAISGSYAKLATLLARKGALVLASRSAGLVLPNSVIHASRAVVALLLAHSALALAAQDK